MATYKPLLVDLAAWFDKPLSAVPSRLKGRIEEAFFPFVWDHLNAGQRRVLAVQYDAQNDPRFELERQAGFDLAVKRRDLRRQMETWNTVGVTTATEAALKEERLKQLHAELRRLEPRPDRRPKALTPPTGYVAYPKAASALSRRLDATPEEIAAWIWLAPEEGGIAAYRNANEVFPPSRFFFDPLLHEHGDYVAPLMGCWFEQSEIDRFLPNDRFMTGSALIHRWAAKLAHPTAFIEAKLAESRLTGFHPIFGGTREMFGNDVAFPPLDKGLFPLSEIQRIEAEDFPSEARTSPATVGSPEWRQITARKAADAKHDKPGGSREKRAAIRAVWASGKYDTRDLCAEEEGRALGMSSSAARKALMGTPEPDRKKVSPA